MTDPVYSPGPSALPTPPDWVTSERYRTAGLADAPYVTSVVEPIGGHIKERNEDFLVDELPLIQPSGSGDYLWAFVQKAGLSTTQMVDVLADHFKVRPRDISFAGMKDKRAVTRQVVSIHTPGRTPESFPMFEHPQVQILWIDVHSERIRRSQLAGNGFSVRVRACDPMRVQDTHRILNYLSAKGVPNYYGAQRFGARLNNHLVGRDMIAKRWTAVVDQLLGPDELFPALNAQARAAYASGDYANASDGFKRGQATERAVVRALAKGNQPADAVAKASDVQVRFWVAAWQSSVFNRVLARRVADGTYGTLLEGDVALEHATGDFMHVTKDMAQNQHIKDRVKRFELSPTAALPGINASPASGIPGDIEQEEFAREGLDPSQLNWVAKRFGDSASGTRRPLRVRAENPEAEGGVDEHGPFIRCKFELPPGAFATMVMREVMKIEPLDYIPKAERERRKRYDREHAQP
jgi:tRNA pseudouridine13 synthase